MKRLVAFQRQDHRKIFGGVEVNQPVVTPCTDKTQVIV